MECPDAITPAEVGALAARGVQIWVDDPAVLAMLPAAEWDAIEVDRLRESLDDWLARYDHHLFLIARAGNPLALSDAAPAGLPPELRAALADSRPVVAWLGTGPFAGVRRLQVNARTAILQASSASLVGHRVPRLALLLRADAGGMGPSPLFPQSRVQVNSRAMVLAGDGAIAVGVIDPEAGILVDAAEFQGGQATTVWSMRQLSLRRVR
jgi:hypothetical protein